LLAEDSSHFPDDDGDERDDDCLAWRRLFFQSFRLGLSTKKKKKTPFMRFQ